MVAKRCDRSSTGNPYRDGQKFGYGDRREFGVLERSPLLVRTTIATTANTSLNTRTSVIPVFAATAATLPSRSNVVEVSCLGVREYYPHCHPLVHPQP